VTGTFTVALKLVPGKDHFFRSVGAHGPDDEAVMGPMHEFCESFDAVLSEIHKFLEDNGLDDPTKV
jgi:Ca2+:H+ antiporter